MGAAIYARMSTDEQADALPEDQIARCREYAIGQGWHVVDELVVAEHGISGASRHNRPGLLGLVERIGEWGVLVAFDFARLARNQEDRVDPQPSALASQVRGGSFDRNGDRYGHRRRPRRDRRGVP